MSAREETGEIWAGGGAGADSGGGCGEGAAGGVGVADEDGIGAGVENTGLGNDSGTGASE